MLEQAAPIDVGEPFVEATYRLEGNGRLTLECLEVAVAAIFAISPGATHKKGHGGIDTPISGTPSDAPVA